MSPLASSCDRVPGARHTEHATVANRGKAAHVYYVMVSPQGRSVYQDRRYTLKVS